MKPGKSTYDTMEASLADQQEELLKAFQPVFSKHDHTRLIQSIVAITPCELAKYLQLDEATIVNEAKAGRIPGQLIAGQWRFNVAAIQEWMRRGISNGGTQTKPQNIAELLSDEDPEEMIKQMMKHRKKRSAGRRE